MYMNNNIYIMNGMIKMITKNIVYNKVENHKIVSVYNKWTSLCTLFAHLDT